MQRLGSMVVRAERLGPAVLLHLIASPLDDFVVLQQGEEHVRNLVRLDPVQH